MAKIISTNPAKNYEVVGEVDVSSKAEITAKVAKANAAAKKWKQYSVGQRVELLEPILAECEQRKEEFAQLLIHETGKTITSAQTEMQTYLGMFQEFLRFAPEAVAEEVLKKEKKSLHKIVYEPLGTAAVISPWNFPFGMAIWGIIPNLLVGNTVVFKISEECPLVGKLIEEIFLNHELPEGVFNEVYGAGDVGETLAKESVQLIWFTGSTKVGRLLYKLAAEKFIRVVLEMGGSDPCIVFEDVPIKKAAQTIFARRFKHCGQVCKSLKRLIVHESIVEELTKELVTVVKENKVGTPQQDRQFASLVAKRQQELIKEQVEDAVKKGATVLCGGKVPEKLQGAYFEPTLLTNITFDMRVWTEEVFGPVLPIITFSSEEEAITLANNTTYGLGSYVMSKDLERAQRVAQHIEAGTVEINNGNRWASNGPFGGYKNSGMGREHGVEGFRNLCQSKVIALDDF